MSWDIDHALWHGVRDKILKDRYAGCCYSMASSFSPIIIHHREPLPMKDRKRIQKLFPKWIRIEFQQVEYEGEQVLLYGRGDFLMYGLPYVSHPVKVQIEPTQINTSGEKE